jgi:hypothetical protein
MSPFSSKKVYGGEMEEMKSEGIDVHYAPLNKTGYLDFVYDFTWVRESDVVLRWYSGHVGNFVHKCAIVDKSEKQDRDLWQAINNVAKPLDIIKKELKSPYEGEYYGYHYSTSRNGRIIFSHWEVESSFSNDLEVKVSEEDLYFEGNMIVDDQIYFLLVGKKHNERWHIILDKPYTQKDNMIGVYSGVSVRSKPCGGRILLAREQIEESKAKELLGQEVSLFVS